MRNLTLIGVLISAFIMSSNLTVLATDYTFNNSASATIDETATPCTTPHEVSFVVSQSFTISTVELGVNLTHTWRGDITIQLESPSGTTVTIVSGAGSSYDNYDIMVSDSYTGSIGGSSNDNIGTPYYDRTVAPLNSLSAFSGQNAQGTWVLSICDGASGDVGTFNRAQLVLSDGLTVSDSDGDGILDVNDLDDDNDGVLDVDENTCQTSQFLNGDFEDVLVSVSTYVITNEGNVPGWETTASDNMIEIWNSGFNGVPAYSGSKFAEIDANMLSKLFQTLDVLPGDVVTWSVAHRGRSGTDVMHIMVGPTGSPVNQQTASTGNTAWQVYTNNYTVPSGVYQIEMGFEAISSSGGVSYGNFIDDVELYIISTSACDVDDDGIPNYLDLDSDNDGITDVIEAGGTDPDGDGRIGTGAISDTDGDGYSNIVDSDNGGIALINPDTDSDGIYDLHDIDSDNDGIIDMIEGQTTASYTSPSGSDTDNDGLDDAFDGNNGGTYIIPIDCDTDLEGDYVDTDTDDDGQSDLIEAYDTDNDGIEDTQPSYLDNDGDGLDNAFDADASSTINNGGANNNGQLPAALPNLDGGDVEKDWREDNPDGASLPIELISFEAIKVASTVELTWLTATEQNNDYFCVERSSDGIIFETILKVNGAGNSQNEIDYMIVDDQPLDGISYYRLKQIDFDGKQSLSEIRSIAFNSNQLDITEAYPNPFSNELSIEYTSSLEQNLVILMYNAQGQIVREEHIGAQKGSNSIQLDGSSNLASGVYYIQLKRNNSVSKPTRVIKK